MKEFDINILDLFDFSPKINPIRHNGRNSGASDESAWNRTACDESSDLPSMVKTSSVSLISSTDSFGPDGGDNGTCSSGPYTRPQSNEPRRSRSRVRTYFKRCRDAIIGIGNTAVPDESRTPADGMHSSRATSSWYVNELEAHEDDSSASGAIQEAITGDGKQLDNIVEVVETAVKPESTAEQPNATQISAEVSLCRALHILCSLGAMSGGGKKSRERAKVHEECRVSAARIFRRFR